MNKIICFLLILSCNLSLAGVDSDNNFEPRKLNYPVILDFHSNLQFQQSFDEYKISPSLLNYLLTENGISIGKVIEDTTKFEYAVYGCLDDTSRFSTIIFVTNYNELNIKYTTYDYLLYDSISKKVCAFEVLAEFTNNNYFDLHTPVCGGLLSNGVVVSYGTLLRNLEMYPLIRLNGKIKYSAEQSDFLELFHVKDSTDYKDLDLIATSNTEKHLTLDFEYFNQFGVLMPIKPFLNLPFFLNEKKVLLQEDFLIDYRTAKDSNHYLIFERHYLSEKSIDKREIYLTRWSPQFELVERIQIAGFNYVLDNPLPEFSGCNIDILPHKSITITTKKFNREEVIYSYALN